MKGKFVKAKSHIYQKFNLKELLGEEPSTEQKELFASLVNQEIVSRTLDGNDVNKKSLLDTVSNMLKQRVLQETQ